ncbi:MAG: hypothetical protein RL291_1148 [Pseudomonadota bacterium]
MADVNDLVDRVRAAAPTIGGARTASQAAVRDPLSDALVDVARHFGVVTSPEAVRAGLPLQNGALALESADVAAERLGLVVELKKVPTKDLFALPQPFIVIEKDRTLEIVWQVEETEGGARFVTIAVPGQEKTRTRIPDTDLLDVWDGTILTVTPSAALAVRQNQAQEAIPEQPRNWLWPAFTMSRGLYGEAIAGTVAINVLALALPLFTMNIYDRVMPNAAQETLWALAIGVTLAVVFDFAIKVLRGRLVDRAGQRADVMLSREIFAKLLGARLTAKSQSAGVRANTLREYEALREFFASASLTTFGDIPFILLFLIMVWVVAGPLVLVPIFAIPLLLGLGWLTQRALERLTAQQFRETAQRNAVAVETLVGFETVKAAGAESWAASQWEQAVAQSIRTGQEIRNVNAIGVNAVQAAQTLIQVGMIIVGFYMVVAGQLTTGAIIAATMLAGRVMQPLAGLALLLARLNQTRIAYRLLTEIVTAPQERDPKSPPLSAVKLQGAISFENVTYRYEQEAPPVLQGLSIDIKPGERVGIVGGIGTGKSTLLKLIDGLYRPTDGRVLADGVPVHLIDPAVLRRQIGFALQGADLFHGTVRSNITLGVPGASDADVLRAAERAGALTWIMKQPKGLETPVRERGSGLSGGQRQSITLARALVGDPKILLLDEPTSDMDPTTEENVVRRLQAGLKGVTVIVVTHRPAMLALVDRLIVIEDGKKLLDGPKASVLASLKARMDAQQQRQPKAEVVMGPAVTKREVTIKPEGAAS